MGKRNKNTLPNGRSRTDRFVRLSHSLLLTNAYRSLSCTARALLVDIQFDLPALTEANDAPAVAKAILEALADGRMAPSDAETAFKVVECWRQAQSRLEREKKAEVLFSDMAMF